MTNGYYKILYWIPIISMSSALLIIFLIPKFFALITVNFNCSSLNKYALTKLWHIAVLKQLKDPTKPLRLALKEYQPLIDKDIPKDLKLKSSHKNYCRRAIPEILLCLCIVILGLSYLSYDLHPLACVRQPEEVLITYNSTTKKVELEISDKLVIFQIVTGFVILLLVILYAKQKHLGCKKGEANQKQQLSDYGCIRT